MLLQSIEKVELGKMEPSELMVLAKGSEGVFSSLKLQMAYAAMHGEKPYIPFLDDSHVGETIDVVKKIVPIKEKK